MHYGEPDGKPHSGIETDFFVVFSVFVLCCNFCHPEHKKSHSNGHNRKNQGFIFTSPAVDFPFKIIMSGNTFGKEGQGNNGYKKRKKHQYKIKRFFLVHKIPSFDKIKSYYAKFFNMTEKNHLFFYKNIAKRFLCEYNKSIRIL